MQYVCKYASSVWLLFHTRFNFDPHISNLSDASGSDGVSALECLSFGDGAADWKEKGSHSLSK